MLLNLQINQHLGHRFKSKLEILPVYFQDLDAAIDKYNSWLEINEKYLVNARYLKDVVGVKLLPSSQEMLDTELSAQFWDMMSKFEFIDEPWTTPRMSACVVVAAYRTWVLATHPEWQSMNAQIASTIEEMLAVLAMEGNVTQTFTAIKPWIEDYQNEGFALELAQRIKNL